MTASFKYIERKNYEQRNDLKTKSIYKDSCAERKMGCYIYEKRKGKNVGD